MICFVHPCPNQVIHFFFSGVSVHCFNHPVECVHSSVSCCVNPPVHAPLILGTTPLVHFFINFFVPFHIFFFRPCIIQSFVLFHDIYILYTRYHGICFHSCITSFHASILPDSPQHTAVRIADSPVRSFLPSVRFVGSETRNLNLNLNLNLP